MSESGLCEFVASIAKEGLKHQKIKMYLLAVKHLQIVEGMGDPIQQNMPLLGYVLRGVKSEQVTSQTNPEHTRLPITPQILRKICHVLEIRGDDCPLMITSSV